MDEVWFGIAAEGHSEALPAASADWAAFQECISEDRAVWYDEQPGEQPDAQPDQQCDQQPEDEEDAAQEQKGDAAE